MTVEEILAKLVSFPILGGQSNIPIAEWIEGYLSSYGIPFTNVPNLDGKKRSIHCRIGPPVDGGIILSGHMDVVPVEGQDWDTDPFQLIDKGDGKLYARGSCDMKGFLACCLAAIPEMIKADLKRPIYIALSYDEEIGCLAGPELAAHINNHYEEKPAYALIGEPSMLQPVIGHKGIVIYKTTVNGSAGHSSRIKTEVSAIQEAARLLLWLETKMDSLINSGRLDKRFQPPHSTIHCGLFEKSGIAPNVISDSATFYWDVRVIPIDKAADIFSEFKDYCASIENEAKKRWSAFEIKTVEDHPDVPPLNTTEDSPVVPLIKTLSGIEKLSTVSYAAEAGQFSDAGFHAVICGPGDIAQAHRANEFISKEQLQGGFEMINRLVKMMEED